jgi:Mrp family chromosome partitioning ATPase
MARSQAAVDDQMAEKYRALRSTIKFAAADPPIRSVLVIDVDRATPSQVAERLADAFQHAGDRCVYLDANLQVSRAAGLGITDLLSGTAQLDQALSGGNGHPPTIGPGSLDDHDLLVGDRFSVLLERLREQFTYMIISCASLPQHGDAVALAAQTDATILVVSQGATRRPKAIMARDALQRVGARVLGVVMLEPPPKRLW